MPLVKLLVALVAIAVVFAAVGALLPALAALVGVFLVLRMKYPQLAAGGWRAAIYTPNGMKKWGTMIGVATLIGFGVSYTISGLFTLAGGSIITGLFTTLIAAAAAGGGAWFLFQIYEGNYMKDIFSIIDDKEQFDSFIEDDKPVFVEINAGELLRDVTRDVIGQDAVVQDVVLTLSRRVQLQRKNKPLGVFMFVGATGAGKTELAKALAKFAFEDRLVRFDMNECTDASSVTRLIGSPPGYIGSEQGGQLTQAIKRLKSGVILFDEIEKAHPDLYKTLMGLLDEGRITEQSSGQTMNASGFVIVLTSNAEHQRLAELTKTISDIDERKRAVKDTLLGTFKPEQLARIDEIFCFEPLPRRAVAQIIGKFLFKFADEARVELVRADADLLIDMIKRHEKMSDYGIRELVRLVEKKVLDGMLDARKAGFQRVAIDVVGDKIEVVGVRAGAAA